jgi:hypothetical protein
MYAAHHTHTTNKTHIHTHTHTHTHARARALTCPGALRALANICKQDLEIIMTEASALRNADNVRRGRMPQNYFL